MHKKDYEAIAGVFRDHAQCEEYGKTCREAIIMDLIGVMERDNPRFDRARFLAACRGEDSRDSAGRKVRYGR